MTGEKATGNHARNVSRMCVHLFMTLIVGASVSTVATAQAPNLERMDVVLRSVPDGPVASVFGRTIPRSEFVLLYQTELAKAIQRNRTADVPDEARVQLAVLCLETLIQHELLHREAMNRKLTIPRATVEESYAEAIEQARKTAVSRGLDAPTEAEILKRLGYDAKDGLMEEVERTLLIREMRDTIIQEAGVTVSDSEVARAYDQAKDQFSRGSTLEIQQIFLQGRRGDSENARKARESAKKRAEDALMLLRSGQRFGAVARNVSDSPDAKDNGKMGPAPVERFPKFLADAALQLEPGETSGVVESDMGFHIVKLIEHRPGGTASREEAESIIRDQLVGEEGTHVVRRYCDAIISNSREVRVYLELERNVPPDLLAG